MEGDWGSASWSAALTLAEARRLEEDGDGLDYRSVRAHLGLDGYECEALVPNRYDAAGRLDFDWETLRDHAGQGPCGYWIPFSGASTRRRPVREVARCRIWNAIRAAEARPSRSAVPGAPVSSSTSRLATTPRPTARSTPCSARPRCDATVWNATDRDPPRMYRQLNYDPLAHNPLGRMIEVGLRRTL